MLSNTREGQLGIYVGLVVALDEVCGGSQLRQRLEHAWLKGHNLVGISGVDTRALTRRIRDLGAPSGCLAHDPTGAFDHAALQAEAALWPGLEGMTWPPR